MTLTNQRNFLTKLISANSDAINISQTIKLTAGNIIEYKSYKCTIVEVNPIETKIIPSAESSDFITTVLMSFEFEIFNFQAMFTVATRKSDGKSSYVFDDMEFPIDSTGLSVIKIAGMEFRIDVKQNNLLTLQKAVILAAINVHFNQLEKMKIFSQIN